MARIITNADTWLDGGSLFQKGNNPLMGVVEVNDGSRYGLVGFDLAGMLRVFMKKREC